ncbi:hypothetical protein DAPPUDRAFT_261383 [Daphnia pulex]|uniref:Uncharacterized protein n=1 Tax=Daphnia pulex TaxID=6669 RepID=E9HKX5_DAPPU|nr:hypothetical protein DAPPUDRAFT_261383 [Daphnia pulex]|eukprot:EFX67617.1 hypothetical protein DAPPUDRAFT_261383 [Daphnia pulex]
MEQSQAIALPPINEEDDDEEVDDEEVEDGEEEAHCDLEAIEDPDHLKNLRTGVSQFTRSQGRK